MYKQISKRKYEIYAMDFETHNDVDLVNEYEKNPEGVETSIWLWYLINEESKWDDKNVYGFNLESFFERLKEISKKDKKRHKSGNCIIYDFNLAYEWSFMRFKMAEMGFDYKNKIEENDSMVYNIITTSSMSSVWQIEIKMDKDCGIIIIRDLNKIIASGSLRKTAKAFNLPTQKGDINYGINRRVWYDEYDMPHPIDDRCIPSYYIPTNEELIYCFKDVKIIMDLLSLEGFQNDKEFWKATSASSYSASKAINYGFKNSLRPMQAFRKYYPELKAVESEFVRKTVAGGITYAVPTYQYDIIEKGKMYNGMLCEGILHIDMHQAHPSQMYCKQFPYGNGHYYCFPERAFLKKNFNGELFKGFISAVRVRIKYRKVLLHSCIKMIGLDEFIDGAELTLWDFELSTMQKAYDKLEVELLEAYIYKKAFLPFREYFNENYQLRKIAKKEKNAYEIAHRKLLNNGCYGKFLENGHNREFIPLLESFDSKTWHNDTPEDSDDYNVNARFTYLPIGSCVAAYTRCWLIETALLFGYKNILYFDTDSIFCLYNKETKKVFETLPMEDELYNWGLEEISERAQFVCPKRYKIECDGEATIHAAGFNFENGTAFDKANLVDSEHIITRSYRIKGGTILAPQTKRLSVDVKYMDIYLAKEENLLK